MKKKIVALLTFVLVLSMGMTALAKPSSNGGKGGGNSGNKKGSITNQVKPEKPKIKVEVATETVEETAEDKEAVGEDKIKNKKEKAKPNDKKANVKEKQLEKKLEQFEKKKEQLEKFLQKHGQKPEEIQALLEEIQPVSGELLIKGKQLKFDLPPVIKQGRTLIPVRAITQGLGAELEWDSESQTVTITKGDKTIILKIGSNEATVNGQVVTIEMPASLISNRTFVPVRFISEILGEEVNLDEDTGDITIGDNEDDPADDEEDLDDNLNEDLEEDLEQDLDDEEILDPEVNQIN